MDEFWLHFVVAMACCSFFFRGFLFALAISNSALGVSISLMGSAFLYFGFVWTGLWDFVDFNNFLPAVKSLYFLSLLSILLGFFPFVFSDSWYRKFMWFLAMFIFWVFLGVSPEGISFTLSMINCELSSFEESCMMFWFFLSLLTCWEKGINSGEGGW